MTTCGGCQHADKVDELHKVVLSPGSPEAGLAYRTYRIESALKWLAGVASLTTVGAIALLIERVLGG